LLIDYVQLPDLPTPQTAIARGDATVLSIAAASIIAKQSRDRLMIELDQDYPSYGFARHKGYGTDLHRAALSKFGPSPIHRRSFAPLRISSEV
jgi:ribonuclease HII